MPTPSISALAATTLKNYSKELSDNLTVNCALLYMLKERGNIRLLDGGEEIYETLIYGTNTNAGWYSGADTLPVSNPQLLTSAVYQWKQLACPVVFTGDEKLKNSGRARVFDLVKSKIEASQATLNNLMHTAIYSDGTGDGGKQLTGLDAAAPTDPTTGTYGGINRADFAFWRPKKHDPASTPTKDTILLETSTLYNQMVRGTDQPDLIAYGSTLYSTFESALNPLLQLTPGKLAQAGFQTIRYRNAEVLLENSSLAATDGFFVNTKYVKLVAHKDRNMVPIDGAGQMRAPVNQDAEAIIIGWFGNLVVSNSALGLGRFIGS